VIFPNFESEHFVLLASPDKKIKEIMFDLRLTGPLRMRDATSEFVNEILSIVWKSNVTVHVNISRFYNDSTLRITSEIKEHIFHEGREAQVVQEILKVAKMDRSWKVLTKWSGYEEPTWKNAQTLFQDVPEF
jgi:hypothetical protein